MSKYHPPSATEFINFISKIVSPLKFKKVVVNIDEGPVLWVGDTHGFYDNITHAFELAKENSVSNLIFLGDYVDRGPLQTQTLANVAYSYAKSEGYEGSFDFLDPLFRESFPFKIIALKGNHEDIAMNRKDGFLDELIEIYGKSDLKSIIQSLELIYDHFPIMVETSWGTLGVHGGIPDLNSTNDAIKLNVMNTLRKLRIPIRNNPPSLINNDLVIAIEEFLWNDPSEKISNENIHFSKNSRGNVSKVFNQKAFNEFKENFGFNRLVRGHQSSRGSYESLWEDTLIHIFSGFPYFGKCKTPAYFLEFEDGSGKIIDHQNQTLYLIKN